MVFSTHNQAVNLLFFLKEFMVRLIRRIGIKNLLEWRNENSILIEKEKADFIFGDEYLRTQNLVWSVINSVIMEVHVADSDE